MKEKKVSRDDLKFITPPSGQNVSRFVSETLIHAHYPGKTIEEALGYVIDVGVGKGFEYKFDSVDR